MSITTGNNIKSSETYPKKRRRTSLSLLVSVMESNQMMMSPIEESLHSAGIAESPNSFGKKNSFDTKRFGALTFPLEMQNSFIRSARASVQSECCTSSSANLEHIYISTWEEHSSSEEILIGKSNINNRVLADHYIVNNRVSADHGIVNNRGSSGHYSWHIRGQKVDLSFTDEFRDLGNNIKMFTLAETKYRDSGV